MMSLEVQVCAALNTNPASSELLHWAKENIREDPDKKCQIVSDLRDLIYERGECVPVKDDDEFLLRFLRSRKFSIEPAYRLFIRYHNFRETNSSYYKGVDFGIFERLGSSDVVQVLPYLDQHDRRILLYKLGNWNPECVSTDDIFTATLLILELAMLEETAQVKGGVMIMDCSNLRLQHLMYTTPTAAQKIIELSVTSHPMKLNEVHIVNQSWMFETIFNVVKPFLHEKMKEKIFFHGTDLESFHKHIDPKCLPDIYGGLQTYYSYKDWIEYLSNNDYIVNNLKSIGYAF